MTDQMIATIVAGAPNFIGFLIGLWALLRVVNLQHALIIKQQDDISKMCERAATAETLLLTDKKVS